MATRGEYPHPHLSIIVAASEGSNGLTTCLNALAPQRREGVEILVVAADQESLEGVERLGAARKVRSAGRLVPEIWRDGIDAARGDLVALTTADHVPDRGWVRAILASHSSSDADVVLQVSLGSGATSSALTTGP